MKKPKQENYSKEAFNQTEESETSLRAQLATAKPEDIIAIGTQLQALAEKKGGMKEEAHGDALEMNKEFDQTKAAEEAAKENARVAERIRLQAEETAQKLAEVRAKLSGGDSESIPIEDALKETSEVQESEHIEQSIENEPLSPVLQKYQKNIEELFFPIRTVEESRRRFEAKRR